MKKVYAVFINHCRDKYKKITVKMFSLYSLLFKEPTQKPRYKPNKA